MAIADFCTLSELRAYISPNRTDPGAGADDVDGALAITAASDAVRRAMGRPMELQTVAQDRYYTATRPFGSNLINLAYWYPWPAVYPSLFASIVDSPFLVVNDFVLTNQTLANITVTDTVSGTTYTPVQTFPYNASVIGDGACYRLIFAAGTFLPLGQGQLKVNAKWGWVTVPTPVKQACLLQASRYLKRRDTPSGQVAGIAEMGTVVRVRPGLDPDIELMLTPYRRWWVAA